MCYYGTRRTRLGPRPLSVSSEQPEQLCATANAVTLRSCILGATQLSSSWLNGWNQTALRRHRARRRAGVRRGGPGEHAVPDAAGRARRVGPVLLPLMSGRARVRTRRSTAPRFSSRSTCHLIWRWSAKPAAQASICSQRRLPNIDIAHTTY